MIAGLVPIAKAITGDESVAHVAFVSMRVCRNVPAPASAAEVTVYVAAWAPAGASASAMAAASGAGR